MQLEALILYLVGKKTFKLNISLCESSIQYQLVFCNTTIVL